jgi:hypothetical protein
MPGHSRRASAAPRTARAALVVAALPLLLAGCATPLGSARQNFYANRLPQAEAALTNVVPRPKDKVLFLMERGTIRQQRGEYAESAKDYIAASDEIDRLVTYSLSKGATSLVINDTVQDFSGWPFERTLLHAFTAHNHLAVADWDNAAVEARRIIRWLDPERRGDYPEDAYSRYMAGFCLEMIDDDSNAALQYRRANALAKNATIDPVTGRLTHKAPVVKKAATNTTENTEAPLLKPSQPTPATPGSNTAELVCFVMTGRAPPGDTDPALLDAFAFPTYAEIWHQGRLLGRSHILADVGELARLTAQKQALQKTLKTGTRVVAKEVVAHQVAQQNEGLGLLVWLVLMAMEQPDLRRWETLPRYLHVARVPCPPGLTEFDVVFKTSGGSVVRSMHVTQPIQRRRNIFVSVVRDLTPTATPTAPYVTPPFRTNPYAPRHPHATRYYRR